jgi:cell cycle sensor histidine kinase DivJ
MTVQSRLGEGTTVTVALPLSFAPKGEQPSSNIATLTPAPRSPTQNPEQPHQVKKSA